MPSVFQIQLTPTTVKEKTEEQVCCAVKVYSGKFSVCYKHTETKGLNMHVCSLTSVTKKMNCYRAAVAD